MSLHQLAHHVQSAGRGEDKILVHMTPKEVGGLQALAMAHGGSLTINPETGLPEAGFLSSILPMVAGLALGPAGLGLSAMNAALLTGAAGTVMTGSLGKGLMAGLGAYGGAGLGAGLSNMGTNQMVAAEAARAAPAGNISSSLWAKDPGIAAAGREFGAAGASAAGAPAYTTMGKLGAGFKSATSRGFEGLKDLYAASEAAAPYSGAASLASSAMNYMGVGEDKGKGPPKMDPGMIRPYEYARTVRPGAFDVGAPIYSETPGSSAENLYFDERYTALKPYRAPGPEYAADGGLVALAVGGPVETMSAMNAVGGNMDYPQANLQTALYSNPMMQRPESVNVISPGEGPAVGAYTGEQKFAGGGITPTTQQGEGEFRLFNKLLPHDQSSGYEYAYDPKTMQFSQTGGPGSKAVTGGIGQPVGAAPAMPAQSAQPAYTLPPIPAYQTPEQQLGLGGFYDYMNQQLAGYAGYAAGGGVSDLGGYSDGGRLLKGPGDGVSDSIPAVIGQRQPARLADGEFVIPARIVSELGNGSTEAGAKKLYKMMDRVQNARKKSIGKKKVAVDSRAEKLLPA